MAAAAAYLGGDMVYRDQAGVSHTRPVWKPLKYAPVLPDAELAEGELRRVEVGERRIVLARQDGRVYALDERCSHLGGPLADGKLEDGCIQCPWHGSRFALEDGHPVDGPATVAQPCFETRVRSGKIEVRAAD
jgi:nitrite reductase/ring-hydroxylating ferredoxin subunit